MSKNNSLSFCEFKKNRRRRLSFRVYHFAGSVCQKKSPRALIIFLGNHFAGSLCWFCGGSDSSFSWVIIFLGNDCSGRSTKSKNHFQKLIFGTVQVYYVLLRHKLHIVFHPLFPYYFPSIYFSCFNITFLIIPYVKTTETHWKIEQKCSNLAIFKIDFLQEMFFLQIFFTHITLLDLPDSQISSESYKKNVPNHSLYCARKREVFLTFPMVLGHALLRSITCTPAISRSHDSVDWRMNCIECFAQVSP